MIPQFNTVYNWLAQGQHTWQRVRTALSTPPLERPNLAQLARHPEQWPRLVTECPVAQRYLKLLGPLDWDHFPERDPHRAWPGSPPLPRAPFVAAYLIKLDQQRRYMADLRTYLVEHPALVWVLGFPLHPAPAFAWGFDPEASVPDHRLFLTVLRTLDNAVLQFLLDNTVQVLRQELPAEINFGRTIALDTKHIIAWIKENNPKTFIKEGRYDKSCQPTADPDCRLGVKRRRNQKTKKELLSAVATPSRLAQPAAKTAVTEIYWGYGSGIVTTKVPDWGEFILAELTLPFNQADVAYFFPLMSATEHRLGFRPPYAALDAAFDSHYVYDYFDQAGGFAAVPFSHRGGTEPRRFDPDGLPLCAAGLAMPRKHSFTNRKGLVPHRQVRYACPLFHPEPTDLPCPIHHKRWAKGGCTTCLVDSPGARIRHQLDRQSQDYKQVYNQRSATERINALAVELGIERPKFRNRRSITNSNSLIYILLNLRAIHRIRRKKQPLGGAPSNGSES